MPLPPGSAVLVGTITEVAKGSSALRFFVGMGAGQAKVKGSFEIRGPNGESYVRFTSHESYLGGAGIGGGVLDLEDLLKSFGETVLGERRCEPSRMKREGCMVPARGRRMVYLYTPMGPASGCVVRPSINSVILHTKLSSLLGFGIPSPGTHVQSSSSSWANIPIWCTLPCS